MLAAGEIVRRDFPLGTALAGAGLTAIALLIPATMGPLLLLWPMFHLPLLVAALVEADMRWMKVLGAKGWVLEPRGVRLLANRELISWPKVISWREVPAGTRISLRWTRTGSPSSGPVLAVQLRDHEGKLRAALSAKGGKLAAFSDSEAGGPDLGDGSLQNLRWFWMAERAHYGVVAVGLCAVVATAMASGLTGAFRGAEARGLLPAGAWDVGLLAQMLVWGFVFAFVLVSIRSRQSTPSIVWARDGRLFGWRPYYESPVVVGGSAPDEARSIHAPTSPPPAENAVGWRLLPDGRAWRYDERPLLSQPSDELEIGDYWRRRFVGPPWGD